MREPRFWYRNDSWQSVVLRPLGWIYGKLTAARLKRRPTYTAQCPVICIGNINVGGTGKTPTAIALAQRLQNWGYEVHIVSRGYGGSLTGPQMVDSNIHSAGQAGDEPLLLANFVSTWVAKDRSAGVMAAEAAGAQIILLDDGFQNPTVQKDLNIVVVDAERGFGNRHVMPAGPLRETVASGLARAHIAIVVGTGAAAHQDLKAISCAYGTLEPLMTGMTWTGLRVLAFAGIGNPSKFFASLRDVGADVIKSEPLDDHQPLTPALVKRLETEAKAHVAQLVTTEKDAVRLPDAFRSKVLTLPVRLEIEDWSPVDAILAQANIHPKRS